MVNLLLSLFRKPKPIDPMEEKKRGFDSALESIRNGEDPQALYDQSLSDCESSAFTVGWQVACCQNGAEEIRP